MRSKACSLNWQWDEIIIVIVWWFFYGDNVKYLSLVKLYSCHFCYLTPHLNIIFSICVPLGPFIQFVIVVYKTHGHFILFVIEITFSKYSQHIFNIALMILRHFHHNWDFNLHSLTRLYGRRQNIFHPVLFNSPGELFLTAFVWIFTVHRCGYPVLAVTMEQSPKRKSCGVPLVRHNKI